MPYVLGSCKGKVERGLARFKLAMIADLDVYSKVTDNDGNIYWKSLIAIGSLTYDYENQKATFALDTGDEAIPITSTYSRGMRGMELSELIRLGQSFYTVCDRTGIIYEVMGLTAVPRAILANGDGNQDTGFKGEWITPKDGKLFVGSHGREETDDKGKVINRDMQWIKQMDPTGYVKHIDWKQNYDAMRNALGCDFPGYLTHESCVWSDVHKQWFFLPRKISKEAYEEKADETRCGNTLLRCSEDFSTIQHQAIGTLKPSHGFASFKFIPNTDDTVIVAIKSEEIGSYDIGSSQKTFITVFTIDGKVILDDMHLADAKYEGLEFV